MIHRFLTNEHRGTQRDLAGAQKQMPILVALDTASGKIKFREDRSWHDTCFRKTVYSRGRGLKIKGLCAIAG